MKEKIKIKNCGILYHEIILTAMQEYKEKKMNNNGNYCRADVMQDIINKIKFDKFEDK